MNLEPSSFLTNSLIPCINFSSLRTLMIISLQKGVSLSSYACGNGINCGSSDLKMSFQVTESTKLSTLAHNNNITSIFEGVNQTSEASMCLLESEQLDEHTFVDVFNFVLVVVEICGGPSQEIVPLVQVYVIVTLQYAGRVEESVKQLVSLEQTSTYVGEEGFCDVLDEYVESRLEDLTLLGLIESSVEQTREELK